MTRVHMNSHRTTTLFFLFSIANILVLLLPATVTSHPLHNHMARAIGQNIRQLPCKGKSVAAKGVCMFALDCIKSNGTHLGTCIDRFYFGSCCQLAVDGGISYNKYSSATHKPTYNDIVGSISGLTTKNKVVTTSSKPSSAVTEMSKLTTAIPTPSTHATTLVLESSSPINTLLPSTSESNTWTTATEEQTTSSETLDYDDATNTVDDNIVTEAAETETPTMVSVSLSTTSTSKPTEPQTINTNTTSTTWTSTNGSTTTRPNTTTVANTIDVTSTGSTTTGFDVTKLAEMDYHAACGRQLYKERPTGRIVNGQKTQFGEWPWQISLRQWKRTTFMHKCGAALLNENWAITAAHCVDGVLPEDILLRIGEFDLSSDSEPLAHVERRVQIMTIHPEFNSRTFENDLALLRFYDPITFQVNTIPICLPTDDNNFVNKTGFVTGWGRLYVDGPLPNILQEVQVPVITNAECEQEYRRAGFLESIPDIFLCAGYDDGGRDSCEGDSGGPLVIKQSNDRYVLAGIISWGIGCAEPHQPGVYTRISKFRDWVNQILVF